MEGGVQRSAVEWAFFGRGIQVRILLLVIPFAWRERFLIVFMNWQFAISYSTVYCSMG